MAAACYQESLDLYRELDDEEGIARAIAELGGVAIAELDLDRAAALYEEAVPLFRGQEKPARVAASLGNLGTIAHMRGDHETAVRYYQEAIAVSRGAGDEDGNAVNLHNLGRSEIQLGRTDEALDALRESLAIGRRLGYREVIAYCLSGLSELAFAEDVHERSAQLLGAAEELFRELGVAIDTGEAETQERIRSGLYDALGEARTDELRAAGAAARAEELAAS